jgi:hypothetical protein
VAIVNGTLVLGVVVAVLRHHTSNLERFLVLAIVLRLYIEELPHNFLAFISLATL